MSVNKPRSDYEHKVAQWAKLSAAKIGGDTLFAQALAWGQKTNDPLHIAWLLNQGVAINQQKTQNGATVLHYAFWCHSNGQLPIETIEMLLMHGADPNARSAMAASPLSWCLEERGVTDESMAQVVRLLIHNKAKGGDHRLSPRAIDRYEALVVKGLLVNDLLTS